MSTRFTSKIVKQLSSPALGAEGDRTIGFSDALKNYLSNVCSVLLRLPSYRVRETTIVTVTTY
jgi:hypothetical protein